MLADLSAKAKILCRFGSNDPDCLAEEALRSVTTYQSRLCYENFSPRSVETWGCVSCWTYRAACGFRSWLKFIQLLKNRQIAIEQSTGVDVGTQTDSSGDVGTQTDISGEITGVIDQTDI